MTGPTNIYFSCLPRTNAGEIFENSGAASPNQWPLTKITGSSATELKVGHKTKENSAECQFIPDKSFTQELLLAQEQERQSLARELHDNLGQSLILIKNSVLKLKNTVSDTSENLAELNSLAELVASALQKVRHITYDLHPYELNLLGLTPALQSLAEQKSTLMPWLLQTDLPDLNQLFTQDQEIFIYRIIQECLGIIHKQPDVNGVRLCAQQRQTAVLFELQVQGAPTFFSYLAANFLKNYDLLRLQELLELVEGTLTFRASGNRHTTLEIKIPLK